MSPSKFAMITMGNLVKNLDCQFIQGSPETEVSSVAYDSRKVEPGALFVCVRGFVSDGHKYIPEVIAAGAAALLIQDDEDFMKLFISLELSGFKQVTVLSTADTRKGLAHVSSRFFGMPSQSLDLYGITGTKGKTTTTYMLREILLGAGESVGLIGTVSNIIGQVSTPANRTTPESYDLQQTLDQMVKAQHTACVMEVSSQGLVLDRVYGCHFTVASFTNLYHDHIGEHEHANMEDYLEAKLKLFDQSDVAVINKDSSVADQVMAYAGTRCPIFTYSIDHESQVRAVNLRKHKRHGRIGTIFTLESPWYNGEVFVGIPGRFNVSNALCAIAMAGVKGIPFGAIQKALATIHVPGRLQVVPNKGGAHVMVDYAHNSASLESLLVTLREYCAGQLITVFGCGGDRAKSRRYEMGEVSGRLSDLTIITSDNPRSEEPMDIIADILQGFGQTDGTCLVEEDREKAIHLALSKAGPDDFVVIAGKGHENYQIFKDRTIHFDDAEVAQAYLCRSVD